jgi:hypothetical protein
MAAGSPVAGKPTATTFITLIIERQFRENSPQVSGGLLSVLLGQGEQFTEGLLESPLGIADVRGGDIGATMREQPIQAVWARHRVDELGIDEILDRLP